MLVNIVLRPTALYDNELAIYSNLASEVSQYQSSDNSQKVFNAYKEWHENFIKRRLTPWKKFYYLQFHIVSAGNINENFIRSAGTTLTQNLQVQNPQTQTLHGYQVIRPSLKRKKEWGSKIYGAYPLSTGNDFRISVYYFEKLSLEPVYVARGDSPLELSGIGMVTE